MKVLVINTGSSSLKFGIFDLSLADSRIFKAEFSKFSATGCLLTSRTGGETAGEVTVRSHATSLTEAVEQVPAVLQNYGHEAFDAIGHRVVHGGARFTAPVIVDDAVMAALEPLIRLAPLHMPFGLATLKAARHRLAGVAQVAIFK